MRLPWYVPLALVCALAAAIWIAALGWQRAGAAKREAARVEESHKLEVSGIQQAHAVKERDLAASVNLAQRRLGEALAAAGIRSTPIVTVSGSTGPVHTGGSGLTPQSPGAVHAPGPVAPSPGAGERACLMYAGEQGEIRVTGAAARTAAGNVAIDAEASAWRVAPNSPETRLFGGPLTLDVKFTSPQVPVRGLGWGIGGATVLTRAGLTYGPAVASPTFRALWLSWDAHAAATFNTRGDWALTSAIIARGSK